MNRLRNNPSFVLLLVLTGCGHPAAPEADKKDEKPTPTVQVKPAQVGTIEDTLAVTGTLVAFRDKEATVGPPVAGTLDLFSLRVGQNVAKGQIIAHIGTRLLNGQIQQAQATIAQNEIQVEQAQVNALTQQAQSKGAIAQAQAAVANAQATYGGVQATLGGAQATLRSGQAAVIGAEATLRNARQNLTRLQSLAQDGLVAQKDVDTAQLTVQTAQSALNAQQETVAGQRTAVEAQRKAVDAQRETVVGQRHALEAARSATLQNLAKQKDIQIARRQEQNARGALTTAQSQLSLYTIRAPLTGVVTAVGATTGETVDTTAKLATITNLDTLQLQLAVPGEAARKVRSGEHVTFTVSSLPRQTFTAIIETVGTQVDATTGAVTATARIANPGHRLKDDTAVQAQIAIARHTGAILVPKAAVLLDADGKASLVTVGADSVAHVKDVKVGVTHGGLTEITDGLKPGENVALSGQYGLPDGTKVTVGDGKEKAGDEKDSKDKA